MREFDFIFVVIVISRILFLLQIVIMEKKLELYADDLHIAIEGSSVRPRMACAVRAYLLSALPTDQLSQQQFRPMLMCRMHR
jgi:hypothetical protein